MLKRTVPPAVPGVHFLSGGMGAEEATQNLQQLQHEYPDAPWRAACFPPRSFATLAQPPVSRRLHPAARSLSFSYGRALQDAVLKAWAGRPENAEVAQALLLDLARVNGEAQLGVWNEEHPTPGRERVLLPKLSYSSERREPAAAARDLFNW